MRSSRYRRRYESEASFDIWPAMTDVMTVVVMVFMLAIIALALRKSGLVQAQGQPQYTPAVHVADQAQLEQLQAQLQTQQAENTAMEEQVAELEAQNSQLRAEAEQATMDKERAELEAQGMRQALIRVRDHKKHGSSKRAPLHGGGGGHKKGKYKYHYNSGRGNGTLMHKKY